MNHLPAYRKTLAAVTIGLIGWAGIVISSPANEISAEEWLGLAIALATALGVYSIPNEPTI
mgnify:CR=1 FL=1